MPLSKAFITILLLFSIIIQLPRSSFAQGKKESRTRYVVPYHRRVMAPPGMVYVQGGTTVINYDQSTTDTNSARKVSLTSFYMDKTEVTNQEYRRFTEWVIDSIAIVNYLKDDSYFIGYDANDNPSPATNTSATASAGSTNGGGLPDTTKPVVAETVPQNDSANAKKRINWAKVDHDKIFNSKDEDIKKKIAPLLDEFGNVKKDAYIYTYRHLKHNPTLKNKRDEKLVTEHLDIFPNENVWSQDLTNSQTDLYVENYFKVPPFDDYPVVGVTWDQCNAYCNWRSNNAAAYYNMPDYMKYYRLIYTLPSEAQWVYAAQSFYEMVYEPLKTDTLDTVNLGPIYTGVDSMVVVHDSAWVAAHPPKTAADSANDARNAVKAQRIADYNARHRKASNGNLYLMDYIKLMDFLKNGYATGNEGPIIDSTPIHRDYNGMLSNFKQEEGDYWEDGVPLTSPVMSFAPNDFGLYNMEGNVAEWVTDAYSPSAFSFVSDINPQLIYDADSSDADVMKRKVVRGGSFISNAKSLSPFYRDMELQHVAHCYLGFRCVMQAPERITPANATRNRTQTGKKTPGKMRDLRLPEIH
jgi:formylglycine-generating enzyme required for sulfatase activity